MILLANSMQAAGRLGPADSKSGLGAFGRLSACADRSNRAENMSPKGDMRRNALRPEFIRRTRAVNQQYHFIAGRARWTRRICLTGHWRFLIWVRPISVEAVLTD